MLIPIYIGFLPSFWWFKLDVAGPSNRNIYGGFHCATHGHLTPQVAGFRDWLLCVLAKLDPEKDLELSEPRFLGFYQDFSRFPGSRFVGDIYIYLYIYIYIYIYIHIYIYMGMVHKWRYPKRTRWFINGTS